MAGGFLVQLPSQDQSPARTLNDGDDTYVVWANNSADALAMVQNYGNKTVFGNVTPVALAAASVMTNWSLRVRIYLAAAGSISGGVYTPETFKDFTVKTVGVAARAVLATGVLTSSADYGNNETVTIGTRVYTFKTTLTGAADEVVRGVSEAASMANFVAAINGAAGAGTTYGAGTVKNTQVSAVTDGVHAITVSALYTLTAAQANAVATTETATNAAWGAATLTGGVDTTDLPSSLMGLMAAALVNAGYHAAFNNSTHVLTVSSIADNIGDKKLLVEFTPPPDATGSQSADVGVPVQKGKGVPGFVVSQVDGGIAGAALTVTTVADSYVIPTMIARAKL